MKRLGVSSGVIRGCHTSPGGLETEVGGEAFEPEELLREHVVVLRSHVVDGDSGCVAPGGVGEDTSGDYLRAPYLAQAICQSEAQPVRVSAGPGEELARC